MGRGGGGGGGAGGGLPKTGSFITYSDKSWVNFAITGIEIFLEILITILEDQCQFPVRVDDVVESDDILVLQFLQQTDFSQSRTWNPLK